MASDSTTARVVPCAHRTAAALYPNSKRLIVCCDGTWNNTNDLGRGPASNVSRLSGAVAHKCCSGMPQIVYYHPGAGTEASQVARTLGGMFGVGVAQDIVEAYRFICDNYNPGDEIILIGFSRGAFTARSVAGMVCALGFLNRAGLDNLPNIFHDYQTWQDWKDPDKYDENVHLSGFTLGNLERVKRFQAARQSTKSAEAKVPWEGGEPSLVAKLVDEKREFFKSLTEMVVEGESKPKEKKMHLGRMAKAYRELLARHEMSLVMRTDELDSDGNIKFSPVEGKVRAVGVWDTVGSLGMPKMPWAHYHNGRGDDELRFESLDVHPNVDFAFHALALDEWRFAFGPTMWGRKNNNRTELRQVWFPGTHCNVGGGWPDQQIATISLAWMADQLTSIGVEFSKSEMSRIFYSVNPGVEVRKWGMGKICSPNGATSYPDRAYSWATAPYRKVVGTSTEISPRTPGMYTADGKRDEPLIKPNELVHPSVRIRYLYDGMGLDDTEVWRCRALTENKYALVSYKEPLVQIRSGRVPGALGIYHTTHGAVTPFYDVVPDNVDAKQTLVRVEQPHEVDDLFKLDTPTVHWAWVRDGKELPEEHIGMWERMFIKVNEKVLGWWEKDQAAKKKAEEEKKAAERANMWEAKRWTSDTLANAGAGLGSVLQTATGKLAGGSLTKIKPEAFTLKYGYHDMVSWQQADTTRNSRPRINGRIGG